MGSSIKVGLPAILICLGATALAVVLFLLLSFFTGGVNYGYFGACVFKDNPCSTAAATWSLVFGTIGAFTAALMAAVYAAGIYNVEIALRLGQDRCDNPSHATSTDKVYGVQSDRTIFTEKPDSFNEKEYTKVEYDFTNLGRLPLVGVIVKGSAAFSRQNQQFPVQISLGNIAANSCMHVNAYFSIQFGRTTVTWDANSANQSDGKKVAFHPAPEAGSRFYMDVPREAETQGPVQDLGATLQSINERLGRLESRP